MARSFSHWLRVLRMPINSEDLNDFAKSLAVAGSDETQLRASVSRAYYSAFHAVLPLVQRFPESAKNPVGATAVTHTELTERLREWKVCGVHPSLSRMSTTASQLHDAMTAARSARIKADYRLGATVSLGEAKSQVERARRVKRAMAQIDAELGKPWPAAGSA